MAAIVLNFPEQTSEVGIYEFYNPRLPLAVVGETAFLPCRVKNLDEYTVGMDIMTAMYPSWRRYPGSEQMM